MTMGNQFPDARSVQRRLTRVDKLSHDLLELCRRGSPHGLPLAGISGIDGSGKSTLAAKLEAALRSEGVRVALLGIDDWHNPPAVRFGDPDPGLRFFEKGLRFADLLEQVLLPLRAHGSIEVTADVMQTQDREPRRKTFSFRSIDLILFEGVFVFQRELQPLFDLAVWVECSFETALQRALARNMEGLSESELLRDYHTIYYPAQRYHIQRDNPLEFAQLIFAADEDSTPAMPPGVAESFAIEERP
ncbi:MAG: uridine kinase [Candidatus Acidiferrales bacterium]